MNWNFFRVSALVMLKLLAMTFFLAGCQMTQKTQTAATSDARITAGVCSVWKPITYSSKDTPQTVLEVRAGNAGRAAYCK